MSHLFRIIVYPLAVMLISMLTAEHFDKTELVTTLIFFMFVTTCETIASVFSSPFDKPKTFDKTAEA